jgi:hypothetical protein
MIEVQSDISYAFPAAVNGHGSWLVLSNTPKQGRLELFATLIHHA